MSAAHASLIKKHELIKKALITVSLLMIWLTSTNHFAVQFTDLAGRLLSWPAPLTEENIHLEFKKSVATLNHHP